MIDLALFLQLLLWLAVAAVFAAQRSASAFHPLSFYLVFHFLVFVLRPALVHYAGFDTQWRNMRFTPSPEEFVATLAVSSSGLLIFAFFAMTGGREGHPNPAAHGVRFTRAQMQAFIILCALLLPLALYSAWLDARIFGTFVEASGQAGMWADPTTAHTYFTGTTGYIVKAHHVLIPLAAFFVVVKGFRWWAHLPLALICAYRMYLGSRWGIVIALAIVLLLHLHWHKGRWLKARYLAIALPLFLIFTALGHDRDGFRAITGIGEVRHDGRANDAGSLVETLDNPDFANFDFLAYILHAVPDRSQTYTYFSQHLALLTQPVPRMFWPEKPRGPPIQLVNLNDYGWFGTRTRSLVGDGWMSLGLAGVAVSTGFVGWLLGRFHSWFRANAGRAFPVLGYCALMPVSLVWFRDGNLVSVAHLAMWMVLPVLLWRALARLLERLAARHRAAFVALERS